MAAKSTVKRDDALTHIAAKKGPPCVGTCESPQQHQKLTERVCRASSSLLTSGKHFLGNRGSFPRSRSLSCCLPLAQPPANPACLSRSRLLMQRRPSRIAAAVTLRIQRLYKSAVLHAFMSINSGFVSERSVCWLFFRKLCEVGRKQGRPAQMACR